MSVNLIQSVAIKTHRNTDGTYDASIGGMRLGLSCQFSYSARVTALWVVGKSLEAQTLDFERVNPVTRKWEPASVYEFLVSATRSNAGIRYDTFFNSELAQRRVCTVTLSGMDAERWSYKRTTENKGVQS